jgi:NADH:ubiquinone oxidoreductase subunit H
MPFLWAIAGSLLSLAILVATTFFGGWLGDRFGFNGWPNGPDGWTYFKILVFGSPIAALIGAIAGWFFGKYREWKNRGVPHSKLW